MAPTLESRDDHNCNTYGSSYNCNRYGARHSPWYNHGRWIVLAVVIFGAFLLFFLFACITARRRRKRGMQPYRMTGWAGGNTGPAHGAPMYTGPPQQPYGQQQSGQPPGPPLYSPPPQQGYGNNQYGSANAGYFGGQQTGVEVQQPNQAYQPQTGGAPVYQPPAGPPPGKH